MKNVLQFVKLSLLSSTLFRCQCVDTLNAQAKSKRNINQNETPTTKISIFIFPFVLSLFLLSFLLLAFPNLFFMQRWTQNDVHFLWRHLLNSIPSENVFVFRVVFNSFLCLPREKEEEEEKKKCMKRMVFFCVCFLLWHKTRHPTHTPSPLYIDSIFGRSEGVIML